MLRNLKKSGMKNLKKHYILFVFLCFFAAFIGSEFVNSAAITGKSDTSANTSFIKKIYINGVNGAQNHVNDTMNAIKNHQSEDVFELNKGIFASAINTLSSGNFYYRIAQGVVSAVHSERLGMIILITFVLMILFFIYFYIQNVYKVITRRFFLEGRLYEKIPTQRFIYIIRIKKWTKVALTMFLLTLYKTLWSLTIVGGWIKKYSYYLVPYIVAENPDISPKNAIKLSRNMMNGYKWKCFCYEMSFIGWDILSLITVGTSAVIYSNPYKMATFAEFYKELRDKAIENKIELYEYLNDKYLFEYASDEVLLKNYGDVIEKIKNTENEQLVNRKGIRHFLNKYFGISLYNKEDSVAYENIQIQKMNKEKYENVLNRVIYPERLFPIKRKKKRNRFESLNYLRSYSINTLIVLFFVMCAIGWVYEVMIHVVRDGEFVNRGTLHGPWLPIYGVGGILILTCLYNFRTAPSKQFVATVILCGIVEYFTSYILEFVYGQKWWDYDGYFINFNGRICSEGLLIFGIGGLAISYVLAPMIDNTLKNIKMKAIVPVISILVILFTLDVLYSITKPNIGQGITTYSKLETTRTENVLVVFSFEIFA